MKKAFLLKSTSLLIVLFAAVTLFFTSANTQEEANSQAVAELSAKITQLNKELTTLKINESTVGNPGEAYLGEITMFAGIFAPRGWAFCNGQILPVNGNDALFSLLGTTYGGDGRSTFGLPDLRGRVPVHAGTGPGLREVRLGAKGGSESVNAPTVNVTGSGTVSVVKEIPQETNRQPYLGIHYIINVGTAGSTYPPRS